MVSFSSRVVIRLVLTEGKCCTRHNIAFEVSSRKCRNRTDCQESGDNSLEMNHCKNEEREKRRKEKAPGFGKNKGELAEV